MSVHYYRWIDGGTPARRSLTFAGIFFVALLMSGVLCIISYAFYVKEGEKSRDTVAVYNATVDDNGNLIGVGDAANSIAFEIAVTDIDAVRSIIKLNSKLSTQSAVLPANGSVLMGSYKPVPISPSSFYVEQDVSVVAEGDPNRYPFDVYTIDLPYAATIGNIFASDNITAIPWSAYAYAAMQNYRFSMVFIPDPDSPIVTLEVTVRRAPSTKGFSIFIVCIMWLLTLSACAIAFQAWLRNRPVPPPLLAVFVALLFALPAVRNIQPAVPPIGTLLDAVSLVWNMTFTALACITVMVVYIQQGPEPEQKSGKR